MLKSELEQKYNQLKKDYQKLERDSELTEKYLNKKLEKTEEMLEQVMERERQVLLNLVAIQFREKVNAVDPNTKTNYEEILSPDLERGYQRPVKEKNMGLGRLY